VLTLADHVALDDDDPHWWQDPRNAIAAVAALRDALIESDPAGADSYRRNARAYTERLERLDAAVKACIDKVPAADRTLVTTHDALGYYARRYGIRVVGAVIPSRSTVAQPSAGEISRLVDTIRREHVKAVFAESSVRPDVEDAIARESGARVGRALWADTLGPPGSGGATYVDSIASNTAALVDGFSGGEISCRP
jgi:zinc/manganese transport system substrate-binding protein/manganese/iron transport system substrate-binding protein